MMTKIRVKDLQKNEEGFGYEVKKIHDAIQDRLFFEAKLKFNKEKITPILVKFKDNFGKLGKKPYIYFFENDKENIEIGHDVIVPVIIDYAAGTEVFKIARVEATFDCPNHGDWDRAIDHIINFKDDTCDTEPRFIVLNLGFERDYAKNYRAAKEKIEKQKVAFAKLDALVAREDKMARYKALANTNPEIAEILKDLGEL